MLVLLFLLLSCSKIEDYPYQTKGLTNAQLEAITCNNFHEVAGKITPEELGIVLSYGNIAIKDEEYVASSSQMSQMSAEDINKEPKDRNKDGDLLLTIAALAMNESVVRFLVDNGSDIFTKNNRGLNVLHLLVMSKESKAINMINLIRQLSGGNLDIKSSHGITPLLLAVRNYNYKMAQFLMDNGADPDIELVIGTTTHTPMIDALHVSDVEMVKIIEVRGTIPENTLVNLITSLNHGAKNRLEIVEHLITKAAPSLRPGFTAIVNSYKKGREADKINKAAELEKEIQLSQSDIQYSPTKKRARKRKADEIEEDDKEEEGSQDLFE